MPQRLKTRPTLRDVARLANVSYATVSYVLNNTKCAARITDKTRTAILKAAKRLQYLPDPMGRALQRGYTDHATLLIVTWEMAVSHAATAMAVSRAASARDLDVSVHVAESHQDAAAFLEKRMIHNSGGLLVIWDSPASKNSRLTQLAAEGVPVVDLLPDPSRGVFSVTADREDASRRAIKHLIQLGHRKIAVLAGSDSHVKTRTHKLAGYRSALAQAGIPYDRRLIENAVPSNYQGGSEAFQRLVRRCPDITALFCFYDDFAIGAMTAASDMGWRCPEDISVIGFGDAPHGRYWRPGLASFSLSCDAVAAKALELLIHLRKNGRQKARTILVPQEFIVRHSTAAVRKSRDFKIPLINPPGVPVNPIELHY